MLKIYHTTHLPVPHIRHSSAKLALSPVMSENDELIEAIETDSHGEQWQLNDIDAENLNAFWSGVGDDLAKDPEWFTFAND